MKSDKGPWKDPNILKIIFSGEALYSRKIVTISNSDGRIISCDKPRCPMMKTSDASTAESGSEVEDIASPKPTNSYLLPRLTSVCEGKAVGKVIFGGGFSEYDENIPIVDKTVVDGLTKDVPSEQPYNSAGTPSLPSVEKNAGVFHRFWAVLATFFITLVTVVCSLAFWVPKNNSASDSAQEAGTLVSNIVPKEELHLCTPAPRIIDAGLLACVLKRLSELEEKVGMLQTKPFEMPCEKEELLNAAVYRVDALEAELIATKKALHDALIRQEELLAYIDSQNKAKFQKKRFCW
uniref:Uncharacterized protein MANES_05G155900 n=1 Tax=Rhizophora mucronata TaxID=61149 RepID=A0A2P2IZA4_RHIMU